MLVDLPNQTHNNKNKNTKRNYFTKKKHAQYFFFFFFVRLSIRPVRLQRWRPLSSVAPPDCLRDWSWCLSPLATSSPSAPLTGGLSGDCISWSSPPVHRDRQGTLRFSACWGVSSGDCVLFGVSSGSLAGLLKGGGSHLSLSAADGVPW